MVRESNDQSVNHQRAVLARYGMEPTVRDEPELLLLERLSPREVQVLQLCASDLKQEAVAHELGISLQTVKNHLSAIYRKLGVQTLLGACVEMGWVDTKARASEPHEEPLSDAGGVYWTLRHRRT